MDHAVAPLITNNYTQSTCYLIVNWRTQIRVLAVIEVFRERLLLRRSFMNIICSLNGNWPSSRLTNRELINVRCPEWQTVSELLVPIPKQQAHLYISISQNSAFPTPQQNPPQ